MGTHPTTRPGAAVAAPGEAPLLQLFGEKINIGGAVFTLGVVTLVVLVLLTVKVGVVDRGIKLAQTYRKNFKIHLLER